MSLLIVRTGPAKNRRVIREELQNLKISGPTDSYSQPANEDDEDTVVSPFDFLDALEQMDNL